MPIRFQALDTPVHISCADAAIARRLRLVYAAMPATNGGPGLEATLTGGDGAWEIGVEGREPVGAVDAVGAVRALNHELLHGIMLREPGRFFAHAAVVASAKGAIVLPGLSGSGKSTLALACLLQGAAFLSDELLVFEPDSGLLRAFPRALKIRDPCVGYFPRVRSAFVGSGEGRFLPLARVPGTSGADAVPAAAIVAPRWSPVGSDVITRRSSGQGLLLLCQSALNFGTHRERSIDHLAALVRGSRCGVIEWSDPHRAARAILELVE